MLRLYQSVINSSNQNPFLALSGDYAFFNISQFWAFCGPEISSERYITFSCTPNLFPSLISKLLPVRDSTSNLRMYGCGATACVNLFFHTFWTSLIDSINRWWNRNKLSAFVTLLFWNVFMLSTQATRKLISTN